MESVMQKAFTLLLWELRQCNEQIKFVTNKNVKNSSYLHYDGKITQWNNIENIKSSRLKQNCHFK